MEWRGEGEIGWNAFQRKLLCSEIGSTREKLDVEERNIAAGWSAFISHHVDEWLKQSQEFSLFMPFAVACHLSRFNPREQTKGEKIKTRNM